MEGVKVRLLEARVLGAPRTAVTPAGTPDRVRLTLPLRPIGFETVMVLATLAPPTSAVRLEMDGFRLKPGVGTIRVITELWVSVGAVPVTVTK